MKLGRKTAEEVAIECCEVSLIDYCWYSKDQSADKKADVNDQALDVLVGNKDSIDRPGTLCSMLWQKICL